VDGNDVKAKQLLNKIEPKTLPATVAGQVALVKAALMVHTDPEKAMELLDFARIVAPGTLVEEAALRREIFLSDEINDFSRFIRLASQYIRRFQNSVYADNFHQRFAKSVVHCGVASDVVQFAKLDKLLSEVRPDNRLSLYLSIAQSGITAGKINAARFAAERAASLANSGTIEDMRARLYEGVALILTQEFEEGLAKIRSVDTAHLAERDAELAKAIEDVSAQIVDPAHDLQAELGPEPPQSAAISSPNSSAGQSASALIDLAQGTLVATNALLKRNAP